MARLARPIIILVLMSLGAILFSSPRLVRADSASLQPHSPILISSHSDFTSDNGVTGGSGTSDDPYVISGWAIGSNSNQAGCDDGILVANTTAYFTISRVSVFNSCVNGIILSQIEDGRVQDSQITVQRVGVKIDTSNSFQITRNTVGAQEPLVIYNSDSFDLSYNDLQGGVETLRGSYISDASIVGNTGGGEDGMSLDNISGLLVSQNSIRAHVSLSVSNCGNTTIDSNTANAFNDGIVVSECSDVSVTNNLVTSGNVGGERYYLGILLSASTNIDVSSNGVSNSDNGIFLANYATGNSIHDNSITNNQCGITTDSTTVDQNYIADNTFQGNVQDICNP